MKILIVDDKPSEVAELIQTLTNNGLDVKYFNPNEPEKHRINKRYLNTPNLFQHEIFQTADIVLLDGLLYTDTEPPELHHFGTGEGYARYLSNLGTKCIVFIGSGTPLKSGRFDYVLCKTDPDFYDRVMNVVRHYDAR